MNIPSRIPHRGNLDRVPLNSNTNSKTSKLTRKGGTKESQYAQDSKNGKISGFSYKNKYVQYLNE